MAPIVSAVRSALLHAEPSHDTQAASSAATLPSVLIGITLSIICVVVAIGAVCWLLRKRKAAKRSGQERPWGIDTTFAGTEVKYRRVSELPGSEAVPPGYLESSQSTSCQATLLSRGEDNNSVGDQHQRVPISFQKAVNSHAYNLREGGIDYSPVSRVSRKPVAGVSIAAARSDSSKEKECGTPQQVFPYYQRTLLELPGMFVW